MPPPDFVYFDLGNVLINFSHRRAAEQMSLAAGVPCDDVWRLVFEGPLQTELETGRIDSRQFCAAFRAATCSKIDDHRLMEAASDIFWLNAPIVPIVGQLAAAGFRMGVLSNTCQAHWTHVWRRFSMLRSFFPTQMLSFEFGVMKPASPFFQAAIQVADVPPERIFFVDDRPEHVAGAKDCGIDAVPYTTPSALAEELERRGVRINY